MKFVRTKTEKELKPTPPPKAPKAPKAPKPPKKKGRGTGRDARRKSGGKPSGKQKFVLFVGDEGAILIYMHGATVLRRLFAASAQPEHTSTIRELMSANPKVPLYILADVIDQQYVKHTFPPVSSLSVNNLVKRRLERDFQAEDITGFIRLGREATGRKEWQYLLIALANTPLMQQWLDTMVEQPNELKGIFLSPVESQNYISQLHNALTEEKPLPWQLLVSHHKVSGFRQVVTRGGKLVFTRITQAIEDAMPAVIAGNIEQEIMNTLEYLRRLGFLENNTLEIIVVASGEVKDALDINRFGSGMSWVLSPYEVADHLRLEQAALSADRFGDVVMAAAFARSKKPIMKLMTAYAKKLSQIYGLRLAIKGAGALILLLLLGMSAMNVLAAIKDSASAAETEAKRRPIQADIAKLRGAIDSMNEDVALKAAVMLTYDAYTKAAPPPSDFIDTLAPLMTRDFRPSAFIWGGPGAATIDNASLGTATIQEANASNPAGPLEMKVKFDVATQYDSVPALTGAVDGFVERLKQAMPAYEVLPQPYAWNSGTAQEENREIALDGKANMPQGNQSFEIIFHGPKPGVAAAPAGGEGAPQPVAIPSALPGQPGGQP